MKLPSFLFAISFICQTVLSHPLDLPFSLSEDEMETLQRRRSGSIITTGTSGSVQPRLEIRQMQAEQPNQFTLYILAMAQWQAQSQSSSTSYYQIAGIHGVPRQSWNGVGPCSGCSSTDGYCTHDSVLFPAWHRSYMALFEQEFVAICKSIAKKWTGSDKAQMQSAANVIRHPYWDWAAAAPDNGNIFPDVLTQPQITVAGKTIANPLYQYTFTSESSLVYGAFTQWPHTLRWPSSDASTATSQDASATSAFNNIGSSLREQVYNLFTTCTEYLYFSNDAAESSSSSCSNSIEGIHNTIHTTSGGVPSSSVPTSGHMYYLAVAAFDPVFWLHHCNVDRIFAMWQTLHPTSFGASQVALHNTWTIEQGSTQGPTSPLTPFYQSEGNFWTTDAVQNWTIFHYTYPEFADSDGSAAAISNYVNNLYGPNADATAGSSKRDSIEKRGFFSFPTGATAQNGSSYQYIANIQAPRYALGDSYYIFLFLGSPASEDPSSWITDDNLVGPMGVLAQSGMAMTKNVTITGSIPLTSALTSKLGSGPLADLTEVLVGPFLKDLLEWRILGPDGNAVDPDSLQDFEVSVFSTTATNPESGDSLPEYSEFIPMPVATHGKSGGLSSLSLGSLGGLGGFGGSGGSDAQGGSGGLLGGL